MVIILVLFFVIAALSITWYQGVKRYRTLSDSPVSRNPAYQFKMENLAAPAGIYFSPTHSWAHLLENGRAKIGIDAFIQGLTGVLTEVDVPKTGKFIKQGEPLFSVIHEDKMLSITAPVSGKISAINTEALQNMRSIHRDPYVYGWLCEMEPSNWENETQKLYMGQRTTAWLKTEMSRIRDFFAHSFAPADSETGMVILQEGGDIAESALAFVGKGLWGSFQSLILDQANSEFMSKD